MINYLKALFLILPVIISTYSIASEDLTQDFMNAISNNDIGKARHLLNLGADGKESLQQASLKGDVSTVRTLIALGINPDGRSLFLAFQRKHLEIVKILIEAGPYLIDAKDRKGNKPLYVAAQVLGAEAVRFLIEKGADPNARNPVNGNTPLHIAATSRYSNRRNPTMIAGYWPLASPLPFEERKEIIAALIGAGADIDAVNKYGDNPLHIAAAFGETKAVRFLIEKGADPNARNPINGNTSLHLAAGSPYSNISTVKVLINAGADIDAVNQNSNKPLDIASFRGRIGRVLALQKASTGFNGRQLTVTAYNLLQRVPNICADFLIGRTDNF